jgi:hypothetical protein
VVAVKAEASEATSSSKPAVLTSNSLSNDHPIGLMPNARSLVTMVGDSSATDRALLAWLTTRQTSGGDGGLESQFLRHRGGRCLDHDIADHAFDEFDVGAEHDLLAVR